MGASLSLGWWHTDPPPLPAGRFHSVVLPEMKEMQVNSSHSGQEPEEEAIIFTCSGGSLSCPRKKLRKILLGLDTSALEWPFTPTFSDTSCPSFPLPPILLSFRVLASRNIPSKGLVHRQPDQGTGQLPTLLAHPSSGDGSRYKLTQRGWEGAWLLAQGPDEPEACDSFLPHSRELLHGLRVVW